MSKQLPWGHQSRRCVYCGKVGPRTPVLGGYAHKRCLPDYDPEAVKRIERFECQPAQPSLTLTWTHEVPTVEGWYWYQLDDGEPEITRVLVATHDDGDHLRAHPRRSHGGLSVSMRVESLPGRWSGPIPMPVEPGEGGR